MGCTRIYAGAAWLVMVLVGPAQAGLIVGQMDTFEDGTTQGWTAGGGPSGGVPPVPPTNISSGGPTGLDDNFLRITAVGGIGPGSRLSTFNRSQWAGDYIAAGITVLRMDVRNLGPDDAFLRLLFWDATVGPPSNIAITDAVFVASGGDWTTIQFAVDASSMIPVLGNATTALTNATELRIFHNPSPAFADPGTGGPPVVNLVLGVDNVQSIPEPSSVLLAGFGLILLIGGVQALRGRFPGQMTAA